MAVTEFEPDANNPNLTVDSSPEVEEKPPFEIFREGLHEMVITFEGQGLSALRSLLAIREELKDRRRMLMAESLQLEQTLRDSGYNGHEIMAKFYTNQEDQILTYHKLEWLEGYIRDPLRIK